MLIHRSRDSAIGDLMKPLLIIALFVALSVGLTIGVSELVSGHVRELAIQYPSPISGSVIVTAEGGLIPMPIKIRVTRLENISIDFNKYIDELLRVAKNYDEFKRSLKKDMKY